MKFRYSHQFPGFLGNGQPVAYGDSVELSREEMKDPTNNLLITTDKLQATTERGQKAVEEVTNEGEES